jgi:hypothetical protein
MLFLARGWLVATNLKRRESEMKLDRYLVGFGLVLVMACIAAASAGAVTPEVDGGGTFATAHAGASTMVMSGEPTFSCTTSVGQGKRISNTTAEGTLTMSGCEATILGVKVKCNSAGAPAGQIVVGGSISHLVYLDENHTKVGVLATPVAFSFICGGFSTIEVRGSVMGEVTTPKCGATSTTATVVAEATGSTQKYRQIEETGTIHQLEAATKGGEFKPAGTTWTVTGNSETAGTLTCPEQK